MAKKEFPVKLHKDVNDAWCGSAYFVNDVLGKRFVVSVAAAPQEKKVTATGWIKERLTAYENEMRNRHYGWYRVTSEEYDNFSTKRQ